MPASAEMKNEISELLDQSYVVTCREMGYTDKEITLKNAEHEKRAEEAARKALENMGVFPPEIDEVQADTSKSANEHVNDDYKKSS